MDFPNFGESDQLKHPIDQMDRPINQYLNLTLLPRQRSCFASCSTGVGAESDALLLAPPSTFFLAPSLKRPKDGFTAAND